jgi:DNA recombination protein RmuC
VFLETLALIAVVLSLAAAAFAYLAWRAAASPPGAPDGVLDKLTLVHEAAQQHPRLLRDETGRLSEAHAREAAELRGEVTRLVQGFQAALADRFDKLGAAQADAAGSLRRELTEAQTEAAKAVAGSTRTLGEFQRDRLLEMAGAQHVALEKVTAELRAVKEAAASDQEKARDRLTAEMAALRRENDAKLEQMRLTVDEKLQGTLDQRLGEKFKVVSDHLENVQKGLGDMNRGLGEMNKLSADVGGLQRVLTNVKSRGTWGEVQLGSILEDMLTPEQFGRQVKVRPDGGEIVDYVVHLPGTAENGRLLLPLDCKFPHEDYDRLLAAQDAGDPALVEAAAKGLERAVRVQAKSMSEKYIHPPHTTRFAVMYLPTESLFAEVVRRPGLTSDLASSFNVTVTGPTTLAALLNSLKMGFRRWRCARARTRSCSCSTRPEPSSRATAGRSTRSTRNWTRPRTRSARSACVIGRSPDPCATWTSRHKSRSRRRRC